MEKSEKRADRLTKTLLLIYLTVLGWVILLKLSVQFSYMEERKISLIPFENGYYSMMETIMNVVIFIPLGVYLGLLFREKTFGLKLLSFFLISLLLESMQYILRIGTFDVTDLLTNTTGGTLGYLVFWVLLKSANNLSTTHKIINIISAVGTMIIVCLLILLKLNLLPIRYQ